MKRLTPLLMAISLLLTLAAPALAEYVSDKDYETLTAALAQYDTRLVYLSASMMLPQNGQPAGLFVTTGAPEQPEQSGDFALWYVAGGLTPRKLFEGRDQPAPKDPWADIYYTPTSHIQVFEHQGQVYFLVTLYCGNRNGMESLLYMAGPEGVQQVEGFYYGAWAAGTGLYTIRTSETTLPGVEAMTAEYPVFMTLQNGQVRRHSGLPITPADLGGLQNGRELLDQLSALEGEVSGVFYLPDDLVVINLNVDNTDSSDYIETFYRMLFLSVRDGVGQPLACPSAELESLLSPFVEMGGFWLPAGSMEEALLEGHYEPYPDSPELIRPQSFPYAAARLPGAGQTSGPLSVSLFSSHASAAAGDRVTLSWQITGGTPPYEVEFLDVLDFALSHSAWGSYGEYSFTVPAGMRPSPTMLLWVTDAASRESTGFRMTLPLELRDAWSHPFEEVYLHSASQFAGPGQRLNVDVYRPYSQDAGGYLDFYAEWTVRDARGRVLAQERQPQRHAVIQAYKTTLSYVPMSGATCTLEVKQETPAGDGSYYILGSMVFPILSDVPQEISQPPQTGGGLPASLNQRMATRSGPGTKYTEELGTLPRDTRITLYEYVITDGTPWGMVEFEKNGKLYRAYTGMKRIDTSYTVPLGSDTYYTRTLSRSYTAYYGPGTAYATRGAKAPQGASVRVYDNVNGYFLCDYRSGGSWVRAWLPGL